MCDWKIDEVAVTKTDKDEKGCSTDKLITDGVVEEQLWCASNRIS